MKSTLRNMVVVLFTITAVSAFLVGVVNNVTKIRLPRPMPKTS